MATPLTVFGVVKVQHFAGSIGRTWPKKCEEMAKPKNFLTSRLRRVALSPNYAVWHNDMPTPKHC